MEWACFVGCAIMDRRIQKPFSRCTRIPGLLDGTAYPGFVSGDVTRVQDRAVRTPVTAPKLVRIRLALQEATQDVT